MTYEERAHEVAVQAAREAIRAERARGGWSQDTDRARDWAYSAAAMRLRKCAIFDHDAAYSAATEALEAEA